MRKSIIILFITITLITYSCQKKVDYQSLNSPTNNCILSLDKKSLQVNFIAYKFTKKVGVKGKFTSIDFDPLKSSSTIANSLKNIGFQIPVSSIQTGDAGRDEKIKKFFFGSMKETDQITGELLDVADNGSAKLRLKMNGNVADVTGNVSLTKADKKLTLGLKVDMTNFKAEKAVAELNKACKELHTGEDKVAKTWPDVDITVTGLLSSSCD